MKFCNQCGDTVALAIPTGDNRQRHVCRGCGTIHYENPRIVAGCVPEHDGKILLCKRAIEPRHGYWTVPAGFMELDETVSAAAARETWEEAEARIEIGALIAIVDVTQAHQVHMFFSATLATPEYGAGEETLEAYLCEPNAIPWDDLAFRSVRIALQQHLRNRESGRDDLYIGAATRENHA